jgi:hypothetical protein
VTVLRATKLVAMLSKLPNCVPFQADEFGMPSDCVARRDEIYALETAEVRIAASAMGRFDAARLGDVIEATADAIDSDCDPN